MDVRRRWFIILSIVLVSSISEGQTVSKTQKKNGTSEGQRKKTLREDLCFNRKPECERYEFYCFGDSDFMSENCKVTCKMCARGIHLMDLSSKCAVMLEKRKESHCIKKEWLETCSFSCRAYVCEDRNSEQCKRSTVYDCLQNHTYMTKNCKLTCQMCTPGNPLMDTSSKCAAEMKEKRELLCTQWELNNRCPYTCQGIPVAPATSPENIQESKLYPQGQQLPHPLPPNPAPQPPQPGRVIQPQIPPPQQTVQQPSPFQQPQVQLPQPGAVLPPPPLRPQPQPVQPGAVMQPVQPQPQLGVMPPRQPLQPQPQPNAGSVEPSPPQIPPQIQPPQLQPMPPVPVQSPQPASQPQVGISQPVIPFQQLSSSGLISYPHQTQTTTPLVLWQSSVPGHIRQAHKHRGEKGLQNLATSKISHKTKLTMRKEKDWTKRKSGRNITNNDTRKSRKNKTKRTSKPKVSNVSAVMENQEKIAKERPGARVLVHRSENNKGIANQSKRNKETNENTTSGKGNPTKKKRKPTKVKAESNQRPRRCHE